MSEWAMTYCGGRSPLGVDMDQSCLSALAGISRFQDHPSAMEIPPDDRVYSAEPIVVSPLPWLHAELPGPDRLKMMILEVLTEWAERQQPNQLINMGVFWAFPELDEVTASWGLNDMWLRSIWQTAGLPTPLTLQTVSEGRTGMFTLLESALQWGTDHKARLMIGGCDSYVDLARLDMLDMKSRLKSSRTQDGFIPGEGVSLCIFERNGVGLCVTSVGSSDEPQPFRGPKPSTGTGLTEAIRKVSQQEPPLAVWSDLNGESYFFHEWALAMLRALGSHDLRLEHPADCWGELGAATGGFLLALARICLKEQGGWNLVWSTHEGSQRVALAVQLIEEEG
ncbi:MAG: hypothetical protein KDC35_13555 [Acidobacteria bacterium]|nr:hypothetical protein [Acidobacteriota bacterium]